MISVLIASRGKEKVASLLSYLQNEKDVCAMNWCVDCPARLPSGLAALRPGVILLDVELFDMELISQVRRKIPESKIILLGHQQDQLLEAMPELCVDGCLPPNVPPPMCLKAIQAVVDGELWLPRCLLTKAYRKLLQKAEDQPADAAASCLSLLTEREKQLFRLVAKGLANKEIAREMDISVDTVKKHLKNIYVKCGVNRRSRIASLIYQQPSMP